MVHRVFTRKKDRSMTRGSGGILPLFLMSAIALGTDPRKEAPVVNAPAESALPQDDPYLWLEEVNGTRALAWVEEQDARSRKALAESDAFRTMDERFLRILESKEKIPFVE